MYEKNINNINPDHVLLLRYMVRIFYIAWKYVTGVANMNPALTINTMEIKNGREIEFPVVNYLNNRYHLFRAILEFLDFGYKPLVKLWRV